MPAAQEKFAKKKTNKDETSEPTTEELTLYIRLWSNAGNIFLCDNNNIILDSFYRRPKKNELTGNKFNIPLEPNKTQTKEFPIRDFKEIEEKYAQEHPDFPKLTFNQKVDIYYSETSTQASLALLLEQAEKWYLTHKNKQQAALERLEEKRNTFKNAIQWKHQGDLILANAYKLDGKSDYLECDDWDETNPTIQKKISIKIDPKKNAHENASIFYETYKKQTNGLENLEHDIELAKKEKRLAKDEENLEVRRDKLLEDVKEEKASMLKKVKEEIDYYISQMNNPDIKLHEIIEIKKKLEDLEDEEIVEEFNEEINIGDYVSLPSLAIYGKVERIKGNKAHIQSDNGMSFDVEINKLKKEAKPKISKLKPTRSYEDVINTKVSLELNVIGQTVEEALYSVSKYLDSCRVKNLKQVRLIHGFGSGALRNAIHKYLKTQKDLKYRPGGEYEGGGGATVVIFNDK